MTTPIIIFDFITRTVGVVGVDPDAERMVQAARHAQRNVEVTAGGVPPATDDE